MKADYQRYLQREDEPQREQSRQAQREDTKGKTPDIGQTQQGKKKLEEEMEQPKRKKSRGFGMGM